MKKIFAISMALVTLSLSGCSTYHRMVNYLSSFGSDDKSYPQAQELEKNVQQCEQGQGNACFTAGTLYEMRGNDYYADAFDYYQQEAKLNIPAADAAIGHMYENGFSVEQNYAQAVSWYKKGVEQDDATAMFYLSNLYRYGRGVDKDISQANKLAKTSCKKGNVAACSALKIKANTTKKTKHS